jgi:hypothetical protein
VIVSDDDGPGSRRSSGIATAATSTCSGHGRRQPAGSVALAMPVLRARHARPAARQDPAAGNVAVAGRHGGAGGLAPIPVPSWISPLVSCPATSCDTFASECTAAVDGGTLADTTSDSSLSQSGTAQIARLGMTAMIGFPQRW